MSSIPHKKALTIGLGAAVVLAIVAWRVGSGIRSPAQIAADTAAPAPSLITAPVELRTLATEVVVRSTVRYGSPQAVVLAASNLKTGSAIVNRPAKVGSELQRTEVAAAVADLACEEQFITPVEGVVRPQYEATFRQTNQDLITRLRPVSG